MLTPLIDGLGRATWSSTMPVTRYRTSSFYHYIFRALAVLKPLVSLISRFVACSARISVDTHTDRQTDTQTKYCNPVHCPSTNLLLLVGTGTFSVLLLLQCTCVHCPTCCCWWGTGKFSVLLLLQCTCVHCPTCCCWWVQGHSVSYCYCNAHVYTVLLVVVGGYRDIQCPTAIAMHMCTLSYLLLLVGYRDIQCPTAIAMHMCTLSYLLLLVGYRDIQCPSAIAMHMCTLS